MTHKIKIVCACGYTFQKGDLPKSARIIRHYGMVTAIELTCPKCEITEAFCA